jgi:hypothetical protein
MTTSESSQPSPPTLIADSRPAKPSSRRYYIWQAAMWITIVQSVLVGIGTIFLITSFSSKFDLSCLAVFCAMLSPMAIVACSRMSKGRSAWQLLSAYWLAAVMFGSLPLVNEFYLIAKYAGINQASIVRMIEGLFYFVLKDLGMYVLLCLLLFLPLPVTILAALLTIERKKFPPDAPAGA